MLLESNQPAGAPPSPTPQGNGPTSAAGNCSGASASEGSLAFIPLVHGKTTGLMNSLESIV